ncbi:dinitrogenase iron-molybdenum cofactor biosynthesis protein [Thermosipho melanesiensis]|uniref:Dinitrogenase iron-molybdenum cofactor biosynthesis protein n=2 Tax=Thermosipho melanesiensis TaxID=46541 RepID=A6LIZ0_THEM4|nr:NifB/NifX family molybdenum-iron cluster-binding protein [Thermosipho melanesiensis]ABR29891.1 Dinitrogenase iron-molybdenum cofactor biosynthesis protein [Thermosipho melanesiensis BI429]APT73100.1 dinitrogenase iron-molybdenum cofactor biosynthesis protein [Thermosipho melanesiensis]OOC38499.1 dinitrogenase iron-molybdenum cofactor biosynthesis protein [Thermosipho melanesiensis]OOC40303.1 dinitrogenase iron-molybdenum cofactor biosynthesis protein [Thermosipho melanesiensis]OOC40567.1 di
MKLAVPSKGKTLDSLSDERFARAEFFVVYDLEKEEIVEVIENTADDAHGMGPKVSQMLVSKGVSVLVLENVGKNAFEVLKAAGIDVYLTNKKTLREIIEDYKSGKLEKVESPTH